MKKEYIILFGLAVLIYAFYSRNRQNQEQANQVTATPPSIELLPARSAPPPAAAHKKGLTPMEHGRMMALGVRQTVVSRQDPESIEVIFKKQMQWCALGDLDFIKAQTLAPDQAEWRLSLEQDGSISSVKVKLEDMMEARPLKLKFPNRDGVYALYLCKNKGNGSCLNQNLWSPSSRSTQKMPSLMVNAQILARKEGRIMVLPTDSWRQGTIDQLKTVLRKQGFADYGRLDGFYKTVGHLKPFAAQWNDRGLVIPLAMNDPRCQR